MESLSNKLGIFGEEGGSNAEDKSKMGSYVEDKLEGGLGYCEDTNKQPKK